MKRLATAKETAINVSALLATLLILLLAAALPYSAQADTHFVSPTGTDAGPNDCTDSLNPCATIQHAIDEAIAGDTVELLAGTFTESGIVVTKNLTVLGQGAATTVVQGNALRLQAATGTIFTIITAVDVTIEGVTVQHGNADSAGPLAHVDGGGIFVDGNLILNSSVVQENDADDDGGGIYVSSNGTLEVSDSDVIDNRADAGGGIASFSTATVTINDGSHIDENEAANDGGGLFIFGAVDVDGSTISNNEVTAGDGGGLYLDGLNNGVTSFFTEVTISENTASGDGAGIFLVNDDVIMNSSTVSGNVASGGAGGLFVTDLTGSNPVFTATNSTFSGNEASLGGGILVVHVDATVNLIFSTIASNNGTVNGGGIVHSDGTVTIKNTIVADNTAGGVEPDCAGTITSQDFNLIETLGGCTFTPDANDLTGTDPNLGPLAANGGPTFTHALNYGSIAMDHVIVGASSGCQVTYDTDQRDSNRAEDGDLDGTGACDIGAFETLAPDITIVKTAAHLNDDGDNIVEPGETLEYTIVVTNNSELDVEATVTDEPDDNTTTTAATLTTSGAVITGSGAGEDIDVDFTAIAAGGGTANITYEVTVDDPLPAGVSDVTNDAVATVTGVVPTFADAVTTPILAAPVLTAIKSDLQITDLDADGVADPGETIEYTVVIENTGNMDAADVVFTDTPDANTTTTGTISTTLGSIVSGNSPGESVEVNVGTLAGGASVTITFEVTVNSPFPSGINTVSNQGLVESSNHVDVDTDDPDTGTAGDPTITFVPNADLRLVKRADKYRPLTTDQVNFVVELTNDGPSDAEDVEVIDLLNGDPVGDETSWTLLGTPTVTQGSFDKDTGVWDVGTLASGETKRLLFALNVAAVGFEIENEAEVTVTTTYDPDSEPGNDLIAEDDQDTAVLYNQDPDGDTELNTTDKDDDGDGILDADEGRTPTAAKSGAVMVPGDQDNDGIPDGLDLDTDGDGIPDNIEAQAWTWSASLTGVDTDLDGVDDFCDPNPAVAGDNLFTPSIFAACTDGYIAPSGFDTDGDGIDDAYDPDQGGTPIVPVDTDGNGIPDYLDIDSDNDGIPDAIEAFDFNSDGIADVLPVGFDSDGDGIDDGYDTVHVPPASLSNITGSSFSLQDFDGDGIPDWRDDDDDDDGTLTENEVPGGSPPNYLNDAVTTALTDADLRLDMFVDDELPFVGNTVIFTIYVVNDGPDATNGVQVSAPVPPGLKGASAVVSHGTFDVGTGLWDIGTMSSGDSVAVEITVEVAGSAVITYSAEVIASSQNDPDSTPDNDVLSEDDQDRVTLIPQEQETFWTPANPVTGTTTSLAFINSVPKAGGALSGTLFAGQDGGGLHRSTDAGENWFPVANDIEGTNVRGLASGNDDVLWIALYGDGLDGGAWRSDDAGSTVSQLFANSIIDTQKDSLLSIAINTANEENSAGDGDVFVGTDQYGVFVSVDDGTSWVRIGSQGANPLPSNARVIRAIDIHEEGAGVGLDRVYIGTHGRGVWRVDYTAGPTAPIATSDWTEANGGSGELDDAVVHDVHVEQGADRIWAATDLGVWYSDDAGATWTQSLRDETYLTRDGSPLDVTVTGRSVITFECQGKDYVLAGTDGDFVWRSEDDGGTWERFDGLKPVDNDVSGLRGSTVLTLAYFGTPADGFVYAGTQDEAVHRSDDCGETWEQVSKAQIAAIIQDMVFDNSGSVERLYAGTFGYGVLVSSEFDAASTLTFTRINRGLTNHLIYAMERIPNPGGSNDVILAGTWGGGVFRTVDGGENWFHMGLPNRVIYDLLYNAGNGFLYATMDRGQIARSIDRGITWQEIGVATNALWSIGVDGNDPSTIYVGTFGAGVFKSTNAGLNFDETNLQIGHIFDFAFGVHPETGNDALFAATSIGVKYTEDGGSTWHDFNDGLTVKDVRTIIFAGSHLLCGTWGGGAYVYDDGANAWVRDGLPATNLVTFVINPETGDLYATSGEGGLFKKHIPGAQVVTDAEDPSKNELPVEYALDQNYPNPFNPTTQIEFALPKSGDVRVSVYDAVGRLVEVLVDASLPAGRHSLDFEAGHLSSGVYFYRLETRDKIMTQKMVLMK